MGAHANASSRSLTEHGRPVPQLRKASRGTPAFAQIEATVEALARRGYVETRLSDAAATGGLSHGLVNFHFETKEILLTETLIFLAARPAAAIDNALFAETEPLG